MPDGYLVTLGDDSLDTNDAITASPSSFTTDTILGAGGWNWTGVWSGNGQTYSNINDTGVYYLATDGNVYFVPDTWTTNSGSAFVTSAPAYTTGPGAVDGTAGDDVIDAGYTDADGEVVDGGDGTGPAGNEDTILAGDGDDRVEAGLGNDVVVAGAGNDTVLGEDGDDTLDGGSGDDVLSGGAGVDEITGGAGADTIDGGGQDDVLHGGGGDDSIVGGDGDDLIHGDSAGGTIGSGSDDIGSITMTAGNIRTGSNTGDLTDAQVGDSVIYDNAGSLTNGDPVVIRLTVTEISNPGLTVTLNYNTANGPILIDGANNPAMAGETVSFSVEFLNGNTLEPIVVSGSANVTDIDDNTGAGAEFASFDPANFNGYAVDAGTSLNVTADGDGITATGTENNGATEEDAWFTGFFEDQSILNFTLGAVEAGAAYGFNGADLSTPVFTPVSAGGSDILEGGSGDDTILGGTGDDSLSGGSGQDELQGGEGADTLDGGRGADLVAGGSGDDWIRLSDGFGDDTITGGETGETAGDTLDLSGLAADTFIDLTGADPEAGTITSGADTAGFSEIENITLGGGRDTISLADGSGADAVSGFDLTDAGDGSTRDQLDVSGLTTDGSTPVTADDVVVSDDGSGNALLTFPGGESITLIGVAPAQVDGFAELVSIGIPPGRDFIVEGTEGGDTIDGGYLGDPEGDLVDAADNLSENDNDSIEAYGGADSVSSGAGDDTIDAGSGNDTVDGGTGSDSILAGAGDDLVQGGQGADTIDGGQGSDTLSGGAGDDRIDGGDDRDLIELGANEGTDVIDGGSGGTDQDTLSLTDTIGASVTLTGDEAGTVTSGTGTATFTEIESLELGDGDDTVSPAGTGGTTGLTIDGGAGADSIEGGAGADSILGGDDADTIVGGRNDTVDGGAGGDDNDTLVVTGPAIITYDDLSLESGTVTWLNGDTLSFTDIENIDYIPCFTPGTQIKTARGEVPVEQLRVGDRVLTRDNGYQTIRWTGARTLSALELAARPAMRPIRIAQGALGQNVPERDMQVSPQHRVLIGSAAAQMWFGEEEVLVAATHLTCLDAVEGTGADKPVTYIHILFDQHEVVMSDGLWSESFQPGDMTLAALDGAQRKELLTLFPELDRDDNLHEVYPAARPTLKAHQARVLLMS